MPSYYQENDCHQLIHDFYAKYADNTKPMSREVMRVNEMCIRDRYYTLLPQEFPEFF